MISPGSVGGNETLYYTMLYSDSSRPPRLFSYAPGRDTGPLLKSTYDVTAPYVNQSDIYRLDANGQPELLYAYGSGYVKPEYDPDYVEFLKLKAKYEAV